jgi:hypothetical protein
MNFAVHGLLIDAGDLQHAQQIFASMSPAEREAWPTKQKAVSVAEVESWWAAWHNGNPPMAQSTGVPARSGQAEREQQPTFETSAETYARRRTEAEAVRLDPHASAKRRMTQARAVASQNDPHHEGPAPSLDPPEEIYARRQRDVDAIKLDPHASAQRRMQQAREYAEKNGAR